MGIILLLGGVGSSLPCLSVLFQGGNIPGVMYLMKKNNVFSYPKRMTILSLYVIGLWVGMLKMGGLGLKIGEVGATPETPPVSTTTPYRVPDATIPLIYRGKSWGKAKYALLISLDGVSYDALARMLLRYPSQVPHLRKIMQRGVFRPMQGVFPSMTWVNHVSMVTGQYPRHHGVLANRWLEDFKKLIYPYTTDVVEPDRYKRTPALYDLAAKRGWKTAALNWPGTQKAKHITYNLPEIMGSSALSYRFMSTALRKVLMQMWGQEYRDAKSEARSERELQSMLGRMAVAERIEMDMLMRDLAIGLVDGPQHPRRRHKRSAAWQRNIPRLMLLHFLLPDSLMHKYGPTPWLERWGIEQMDQLIGGVIHAYERANLWSQTAVFITSDHGFFRITHAIDIRQLLIRAELSRYRSLGPRYRRKERVMAFTNGHVAFVYIRPEHQSALVPKVIEALQQDAWRECIERVLPPAQAAHLGLPLWSSSDSDDSPRAGYHSGAPTLIAVTRPHCLFSTDHKPGNILHPYHAYSYGGHGYFPNHPAMRTFLLAAGPGIRRAAMQRLRKTIAYTVDIAPTLAYLMGLDWPQQWASFGSQPFRLDGRVLTDIMQHIQLPSQVDRFPGTIVRKPPKKKKKIRPRKTRKIRKKK